MNGDRTNRGSRARSEPRSLIRALAALGMVAALAVFPAAGLELVRDGKPACSIVIPAEPLPVESYAAGELQYHVEASTGARLPIVLEGGADAESAHIYLGNCKAAAAMKLNPSVLAGNGYLIKTNGLDLFITGNDSRGDPLDADTHEGTLFGVYDLLENQLQVRWLWPGKLGEVIPRQQNLSLFPADATVEPLLWFKHWRSGATAGERIWLKRQRFGRSIQPRYGHSFGEYWQRFGQTHPEYFAMKPDGTRGLDPSQDSDPQYVHMCVSEPGLANEIITEWKARGMPKFLNVCENDGWAGCACPKCLSWDEPDPDNPVAFNERLDTAKRAFAGKEGRRDEWMLQLGSLSDRYAKFWLLVSGEAVKFRPDVEVVSYVYDNYRKAPVKAMLNQNVLCGLVPQESIFGYSQLDSKMFRQDWSGWEKTGCALFLRPNYTLQAPNFPAFYARTLGEDLKFAIAHGMKGADFDSLTGKYATQGPSLYMLAKILNHPESTTESVIEEFYDAFGAARGQVKEYFKLWESIYPDYSAVEQASQIKAKRKYGCGMYGPFYLLADEIYTPRVMSTARSILDKARQQSAGEPMESARIEWLKKGLEHTDLLLATQRAYERSIDSGDKTEFRTAFQSLVKFRQENLDYDRANFAGLSGDEQKWEKYNRPGN